MTNRTIQPVVFRQKKEQPTEKKKTTKRKRKVRAHSNKVVNSKPLKMKRTQQGGHTPSANDKRAKFPRAVKPFLSAQESACLRPVSCCCNIGVNFMASPVQSINLGRNKLPRVNCLYELLMQCVVYVQVEPTIMTVVSH